MKQYFLGLTILILAILSSNEMIAQSISTIKSENSAIKGRMNNQFYKHDSNQFKEIRNILNEDVFEYYNLKNVYDSELKQKVFKDTEEYKSKLAEIQRSARSTS